jgi:ribosomal protein L11 methyltransferase
MTRANTLPQSGSQFPQRLDVTLSSKTVLNFRSEGEAASAAAILAELPEFEDAALVLLERGGEWIVECYGGGSLAGGVEALREMSIDPLSISAEAIPSVDWVSETQKMLPPVRSGRFIIHGSHDRGKVCSRQAIEIDAGRAFGTAHHGTTKGCLLAIGYAAAKLKPDAVLDLGTGSGILAIAAAKAFQHRARVWAVDIDPLAIEVAAGNSRKNRTADCIRFAVGDGIEPATAYSQAPFGLVMANILAKPLLKLAPRLRILTRKGGALILSGLLVDQAREILGRYRGVGFCLVRRIDLEGWSTLILKRRA